MTLLSIIKLRSRDGVVHGLRWTDQDGTEYELLTVKSAELAQKIVTAINELSTSAEAGIHMAQMIAALIRIMNVAKKIKHASDQQGDADYATKSHMRAWGAAIAELSNDSLLLIQKLSFLIDDANRDDLNGS